MIPIGDEEGSSAMIVLGRNHNEIKSNPENVSAVKHEAEFRNLFNGY